MTEISPTPGFSELGLPEALLKAVEQVGYESPSPIQAQSIPVLLAGHDLLGQAQTGTGKTAAFALPLLSRIDLTDRSPQLLVLTPTRELALQVAEACQTYARFLPQFQVLPIYGGQGYGTQLKQLQRGAQVIVGTPGRVMDHIRKRTLKLDHLKALVLDEADEMLRMGFIDDVEWILEQTPPQRQIALFSATMPKVIQQVANRHLRNPQTIRIASKTSTAASIRQRYWLVAGTHKLDALTRILETEQFDGVIIFVRTKTATVELAEKLSARGYGCEALNGDIPQHQREKTVERLRDGRLDILVATDVAARGLDVQRISHVINYDIPYDTESYVHRIGRTGRAGRTGEAILFVAPRERRMLIAIEKATRQPIEMMQLPSEQDINLQRVQRFKQRISDTLSSQEIAQFVQLVSEYQQETDCDPMMMAAALAHLAQGNEPLLLKEKPRSARPAEEFRDRPRDGAAAKGQKPRRGKTAADDTKMERYRIAVGHQHGVKPGNIVGAIANEAGIESRYIGQIDIGDDHSTVDLPADMPPETLRALRDVWVCQQKLLIEPLAKSPRSPRKRTAEGDKPRKRPAVARRKEELKKLKKKSP